MRHPSEIDDLHDHDAPSDPSWLAGEIELDQERPTSGLRSDPGHRKWMLIGVAGCGLITALAVLLLTRETPQAQAQPPREPPVAAEPLPEAPIEPEVAALEPEPPKPVEKPTLAATARISAPTPTPAPEAPAPEAPAPQASPPPSQSPPAVPSVTPPAPAATPSVPAEAPAASPPASPASDLPDVEAWDDADAAVEHELTNQS